jgi:hypothetical protein
MSMKEGGPAPTVPENSQQWAGMEGHIAFHLIERHADNWSDIDRMMKEWLAANSAPSPVAIPEGMVLQEVINGLRQTVEKIRSDVESLKHLSVEPDIGLGYQICKEAADEDVAKIEAAIAFLSRPPLTNKGMATRISAVIAGIEVVLAQVLAPAGITHPLTVEAHLRGCIQTLLSLSPPSPPSQPVESAKCGMQVDAEALLLALETLGVTHGNADSYSRNVATLYMLAENEVAAKNYEHACGQGDNA